MISQLVVMGLVKIPVQAESAAVEEVNSGGEARRPPCKGTLPPVDAGAENGPASGEEMEVEKPSATLPRYYPLPQQSRI